MEAIRHASARHPRSKIFRKERMRLFSTIAKRLLVSPRRAPQPPTGREACRTFHTAIVFLIMLRYLPLMLKNCWRNRRRTVLTIASIGVSMCLLGVMMAVYHAFYMSDPTPDQALRLVT